MKKRIALTLISSAWAVLSSSALAQEATIATKTVAAKNGGRAETPTTELKVKVPVNPFTGKPLSAEQLQRELEESRLKSQLLEEVLKQTTLSHELANVGLRKSVEAAQAKTAATKEGITEAELVANQKVNEASRERKARLEREEDEERRRKAQAVLEQERAAKAATAAAKKKQDEAERQVGLAARTSRQKPTTSSSALDEKEAAVKAAKTNVSLTSVMDMGGTKVATLDFDGSTLIARDGENTPAGVLEIKSADTVVLGGHTLSVHANTLGRFVVSDAKPPEPVLGGRSTPVVAPQGAAPAASPTSAPQTNGQKATLPPLQLPPGISVLPPSVRPAP